MTVYKNILKRIKLHLVFKYVFRKYIRYIQLDKLAFNTVMPAVKLYI